MKFEGRIANKKDTRTAKLKPGWRLNEDFKELWRRIKHKTRYAVDYKTPELIEKASQNLAGKEKISASKISIQKSGIHISGEGLEIKRSGSSGDNRRSLSCMMSA